MQKQSKFREYRFVRKEAKKTVKETKSKAMRIYIRAKKKITREGYI